MGFLTVDEFVHTTLPNIVADKERMNALFVSYHEICDYPNGPVVTGDERLQVIVNAGDLRYYDDIYKIRDEARVSLAKVSRDLGQAQTIFTNDAPTLVVVYVGLVAFYQALTFVHELRKQLPQAIIATLTCDCDQMLKAQALHPLVWRGEINYALMVESCGGFGPMGDILSGLLNVWRNKNRQQK